MPGGDRTGPRGLGATTGRRAGFCLGFGVPGFANRGVGTGVAPGFGGGRGPGGRSAWAGAGRGAGYGGGGRGWRHWYYATGLSGWLRWGQAPAQAGTAGRASSRQALENRARALQTELDDIHKRLGELGTSDTDR